MVGHHVMTEKHVLGSAQVSDPVALGSYHADSHYTQRLAIDGTVRVEGAFFVEVPSPYGISYHSITPRESEATNLLVPVAVSASHVAYG